MSDAQNFGFAQFVPGFDFLQNLAKGAATGGMPQMPGLSNWIAPTLSVEELDKRISELRAVMFWLEQNGKALQATIQALEVQKMTLATLKGMDVTMADMAEALKVKMPTAEPASEPASNAVAGGDAKGKPADGAGAHNVVDPLQWWSSLTQQFQQIAANAMQQAAQNNPMEAAREAATGMAEQAIEAASRMSAAAAGAATAAAPKAPARKAGAKAAAGASTRTSAKEAGTASRKTAAPRKSAGGRGTTR